MASVAANASSDANPFAKKPRVRRTPPTTPTLVQETPNRVENKGGNPYEIQPLITLRTTVQSESERVENSSQTSKRCSYKRKRKSE